MNEPKIRMYVDENGHQAIKGDLRNTRKRFLGMTGVIMEIKSHDEILTPAIDALKVKYFGSTNIVLHRREIISAEGPFSCLSDDKVRDAFNAELLCIIRDTPYRVVSTVIDKHKLVSKYGEENTYDPYALALEILMQRYHYWMKSVTVKYGTRFGDILIEARGKGEDRITRKTYTDIYNGNGFYHLQKADRYYSSSEIKLKPKSANIAGLQFVDLIAHPSRRYILSKHGLSSSLKDSSYEQKIVDVLIRNKFRRSNGRIDGIGSVLFPK